HELEGQLPRTSCSVADVTAWAQITHAFACEETDDDREPYLYKGNADRVAVGHLVKAVLGLAAVAAPVGVPKLRVDWDARLAASRAAEAGDEREEGDAAVQAASGRLDDCVDRILRTPVRGLADIRLLADALHWRLWTDQKLW